MRAWVSGIAIVLGACGGAPPLELIEARAAFERAAQGPAAKFNPAGLHVAQTALDMAEKTFETDGNSDKTRDRGYVVVRKVERAEVLARTRRLIATAEESELRARMKRVVLEALTRRELARTKAELLEPRVPSNAPP